MAKKYTWEKTIGRVSVPINFFWVPYNYSNHVVFPKFALTNNCTSLAVEMPRMIIKIIKIPLPQNYQKPIN